MIAACATYRLQQPGQVRRAGSLELGLRFSRRAVALQPKVFIGHCSFVGAGMRSRGSANALYVTLWPLQPLQHRALSFPDPVWMPRNMVERGTMA